jgi:hypothetical protein
MKQPIVRRFLGLVFLATSVSLGAQDQSAGWQPDLTRLQTYTSHRASSADPTGANADARRVEPGASLTLLDTDGPGKVSHLWFTISSDEPYHLKRIVLRIYWDGEATPSVEAPIGDFFGLGLGDYVSWQSELLSVGSENSLNCFFPMPFQRHARITISNEGKQPVGSFYYNIDYQTDSHPLSPGTLYFHAQYRQAQPNHGWTNTWTSNGDPLVDDKQNLKGEDNYVWMEAKGSGQFAGVTMSVMQNQDGWWGEGDDMFFVDDNSTPAIAGTGSEDYFLGAWDFGGKPFSYQLYGAPVVGPELSTVSIWMLPSRSEGPSKPPSSMETPTIARTTTTPSRTGINRSLTLLFRPCPRSTSGCQWCNRLAAQEMLTQWATPRVRLPAQRPHPPRSSAWVTRPEDR